MYYVLQKEKNNRIYWYPDDPWNSKKNYTTVITYAKEFESEESAKEFAPDDTWDVQKVDWIIRQRKCFA